jgi:hypothetical protein
MQQQALAGHAIMNGFYLRARGCSGLAGFNMALQRNGWGGTVEFGARYLEAFNSGFANISHLMYGARNVAYIVGKTGDSYLLTGDNFEGSSGRLTGGEIGRVGLYKNGALVYDNGVVIDVVDFEKAENHVVSIPVNGLTVKDFLTRISQNGSSGSAKSLIANLMKGADQISADHAPSYVVDGFDGNDTITVTHAAYVRAGAGNDRIEGIPAGSAILDGGSGDDLFDGSSLSTRSDLPHFWYGASGVNRYLGPDRNTIIVVDQKLQQGQADVVSYADILLSKTTDRKAMIVVRAAQPDPTQLALRFVNQPLLDSSAKQLHAAGYLSVLYKGIEQVKISIMDGYRREDFLNDEVLLRQSIAVASAEQLIVPGQFSTSILDLLKQDFGVSDITAKASLDLADQSLAKQPNTTPASAQFWVEEIKQNPSTGKLELVFNQPIGNRGLVQIVELNATTGQVVRQVYFESQTTDVNKVVTSIANSGDTNYLLAFTTGWTSASGQPLQGQGTFLSSSSSAQQAELYRFTFGKDTVAPSIQSIRQENGRVVIVYSENVQFTSSTATHPLAYLSRVSRPTSPSDVVYTFTQADAVIQGDTLTLTPKTPLDGQYYLTLTSVKDATGNYSKFSPTVQQLLFEDPLVAARRITIDRKQDNSFLLPATYNGSGTGLQSRSWSFTWAQVGNNAQNSPSFSYSTNDWPATSNYIYSANKAAIPLLVAINDFHAEGVHRLSRIDYYGGSGSSRRQLDTPEEINAELKAWGLEPGSLDLNIVGEGLTPKATLKSLALSKTILDLANSADFISGTIQFSVETGDPYYDRNAQISNLYLRYGASTSGGYSSGPSFYISRGGEILSSDQAAVFQLNAFAKAGLQAGNYVLQEVEVDWDSPRWIKQSLTPAQAIALGLPETLTLIGSQPIAPKLVRELLDLQFSGSEVDCSKGTQSLFVTAKVKVTGFDPAVHSYLQEDIYLSWRAPEQGQNFGYESGWTTSFSDSLSPLRYERADDGKAAVIEFAGLLEVRANTHDGDYVLRDVTLDSHDYNRGHFSTTLSISEQIPQFAHALRVAGGHVTAPIQVTDVDAPITTLQPTLLDVHQVSIASSGSSTDVGLQLYVSESNISKTTSNSVYTQLFKAYLGLPIDAPNPVGFAVLTSPSGRQWKNIFITEQDRVTPESQWRSTDPSVTKYQPKITFTASDEPGTWRLSQFANWSGSALRSDNALGVSAIFGTAVHSSDDQLSALNTEVLAAKLKVQPSALQLQVANPYFSDSSLSAPALSPRVYGYDVEFGSNSVAAGAPQSLRITLETAEPLMGTKGSFAPGGFSPASAVAALRLRHQAEHLLSSRTDLPVTLSRSDIVSEIQLANGRYRTQLETIIDVPQRLYGGLYVVDQLYALTPLEFAGYGAKYRRSDGHITLLDLADAYNLYDSHYGISPGLVEELSPDRLALLGQQASVYSSLPRAHTVFGFEVDGEHLPADRLNPVRPSDLLHVVFPQKVAKFSDLTPEPVLAFSLSSAGYQALLDSNRDLLSVTNRIDSYLDTNLADHGLWVSLVHCETGTAYLALAKRSSQVASPDRHQFTITLDRTFLNGDYRVGNLQVTYNSLFGSSLSASLLSNGLTSTELRYLDSQFGSQSQFSFENPTYAAASLSLVKLGFDRWSPPSMAVVVRDQTPPTITAPSGLKDATVILSLAAMRGTIGRFTANEAVSWSIDPRGRDAPLFVVSSTGELSFATTQIPVQSQYSLDLWATDPSGNRASQTLILQPPTVPPNSLTTPNSQEGTTPNPDGGTGSTTGTGSETGTGNPTGTSVIDSTTDGSADHSDEAPEDLGIVLIELPANLRSFNVASLSNINSFPFARLGANGKLLNWSQINYANLSSASIDAIDWTQVDYVKAQKSPTFGLQYIDWQELHASAKISAAVYKQIAWSKYSVSADVAEALNTSLIDYRRFDPSKLLDVNAFSFASLGSNHLKLDWSKVAYGQLNASSIADIDWTQVDYLKAQKSQSFTFDIVDWAEVNSSTRAPAIYRQMSWGSRPVSSDVAYGLIYSHLDLSRFDITRLADINDVQFEALGQNYSKLPWSKVNYGLLTDESLSSIDWSRVPLSKACLAPSFQLEHVDWDEVSASKTALAAATIWFKSASATKLLATADADALTGLNPTALLGAHKLLPFTAAGTAYGLVTTAVDASRARAASGLVGAGGGFLAELETEAEATALSKVLFDPLTGLLRPSTTLWRQLAGSVAKDGGNSRYLWLGGSDAEQEGEWRWLRGGEIDLDRVEWGEGQGIQEPDNFGSGAGQDALALALQRWPVAAKVGAQIGDAGEWNDLAATNRLGFLVEF